MSSPRPPSNLKHPKHWPTWFGLGVFYLLNLLPWPIKRALAAVLGWCVYHIVPVRRRVTLINLRLAFPAKTESEIRELARAHYGSLALGLFETVSAWWSPTNRLPRHRIIGLEHLHAAAASHRGALVVTGHVTLLEMGARIINEQVEFCALYRDPNNPAVAEVMRRIRERHLKQAIPFDDLRGLLRALKQGGLVWYAPDQGKKTKMSEVLPFFGEPAVTNVATSRIAQMSGCQVIPYYAHRLADGTYELQVYPAWENFPSGDHTADAMRVNHFIEEQVRRSPEQYFWVHKRYKRRGEGYPDVYRS
ncbi:lysophospholipid acyltransferase family protein [Synoicihabitans lomoniglobus]|uniref:Lysophospholipid acyltransferase family protein n=1 Tax=Synoicihabitans lomoniglobus TaxID=2909285 RepID=A0AAF0CQP4_9BACT|nr:lysophospholipid acyltransferase family protein [Opitutaceae bacterium LMO-M01]WED66305.1 lysophospholipid acyltransferase family protein [Opitutaceae bacterium LMO-M01]